MKVFVSDLDGTLYPPNVTDSGEENRAAIRRWREAGNVFAVATARIHQSYPKVAEDLGFAVDYLGGNGAELIFSDQTRILRTIKADVFLELADWLNAHYPYGYPERIRNSLRQSLTRDEVTILPDAEIVNLGIILHPDQRDAVKQALRLKLGSQLNIVSSDRDNLDVIRPDCSKAAALALLAERYKVPLSEVIVIGDSENDVGMFNIVKMSYCMADAEPQIQ